MYKVAQKFVDTLRAMARNGWKSIFIQVIVSSPLLYYILVLFVMCIEFTDNVQGYRMIRGNM